MFWQLLHPPIDRMVTKPIVKGMRPSSPGVANAQPRLWIAEKSEHIPMANARVATAQPRLRITEKFEHAPTAKAQVRSPSVVPISAPTFHGVGWEAEVEELLGRLNPTVESNAAIMHIVRVVERSLAPILPGAKVSGFASTSLHAGAAFAVAVPDVEILINIDPAKLAGNLQERTWTGSPDMKKLYKSALRAITDRLVSTAAFKFRRSAFRDEDPKVTLLAPAARNCNDGTERSFPVSFSVNDATPHRAAALLAECGQREPQARALVLLVRRWARDRGLSQVAAGFISPYAWTLVAIYFLQVGSSLLPPLVDFAAYAQLGGARGVRSASTMIVPMVTGAHSSTPCGELLKAFFQFFAGEFDWRNEAVCPRLGRRAEPNPKLPLHIVAHEKGNNTEVGPSIEDPFDRTKNWGSCMTAHSLARLRDEFQRAGRLCADGASLTTLLEPWAPPEAAHADQDRVTSK